MAPTLRSGRRVMPIWRAVARRSWTTLSEPWRLFCTTHWSHCSSSCFSARRTGAVISTPVTCGDDTPPVPAAAAGRAARARSAARQRALPGLLNIADPHTVQQVLQKCVLLRREVPDGFLPHHLEQIDVQPGHLQ